MHYSKKLVAVVVISFFSIQFLSAQNNYIIHTLEQGESLSMLATQYNTTVGDIMRLNDMHGDSKLVYGSKIKIPSTKPQLKTTQKTTGTNTATVASSSNEITHVVAKGETLYSISKKYNVSLEQLRSWNHLTDDNTKIGTLLIISDKGNNKLTTSTVQKQKTETVVAAQTQQSTVDNSQVKQVDEMLNTNSTTQQTVQQPAPQTQTDLNTQSVEPATNYSGKGYFAYQFKDRKNKDRQNIAGVSKTFKTASGWSDGKYYILVNDIEPGTIVKVTADNGNSVYAKVLWNMGDLKENAGINFRVSNATAAALHENEDSGFNVNVSF